MGERLPPFQERIYCIELAAIYVFLCKKKKIQLHVGNGLDGRHSIVFNVHGSVHRKNILMYVQQDATLHSLFHPETALHVGWYLHPSSGAQTTVSTASGICHTVTATCCYRGR